MKEEKESFFQDRRSTSPITFLPLLRMYFWSARKIATGRRLYLKCGVSIDDVTYHEFCPGAFKIVNPAGHILKCSFFIASLFPPSHVPGHCLCPELALPHLRLRRRPAHGLLDLRLGLVLSVDLLAEGLQVGLLKKKSNIFVIFFQIWVWETGHFLFLPGS